MKIAILSLLFASLSFAQPVQLDSLYIEAERATGTNRTPLIPSVYNKAGELNLEMNLKFLALGYNKIRVESTFADSQFSTVALETESGARFEFVDLYIRHRSQHALDTVYGFKYPNENSVGFRVRLK